MVRRPDLGFFSGSLRATVSVLLITAGSVALLPLWLRMVRLWATDPLRSIGAALVFVAAGGVIVAWKRLSWRAEPSYWGLPLVALSIAAARLFAISSSPIGYGPYPFLHFGASLALYGVGAVLLFGGAPLLRASVAPLCLLMCVNPVPHSFNVAIDLPLQQLAADAARSFAHLIGLQPTGRQLQMMFTPNFGMMIVPGCNGIRGAVTLGYLALILGYMRRLSLRTLVLIALMALFSGYLLNFVRLCTLVIYYRIGVAVPAIQPYGAGVDYAIGGTLFILAAFLVGLIIFTRKTRLLGKEEADGVGIWEQQPNAITDLRTTGPKAWGCALAFIVLTGVFTIPMVYAPVSISWPVQSERATIKSLPSSVGAYHLRRTYSEHDTNGAFVLEMADYSADLSGSSDESTLTLGLWIASEQHSVLESKASHGAFPLSIGSLDMQTLSGQPVHFSTALYEEDSHREIDANAICGESGCDVEKVSSEKGFYFRSPESFNVISGSRSKRLPIFLREQWPNGMARAASQRQFENSTRYFMQHLDTALLLEANGTRL